MSPDSGLPPIQSPQRRSPTWRRHRASLRRALTLRRRPIAAVLAATAVVGSVSAARPSPPQTLRAVVMAADLPAGHVVRSEDVSPRDVPPDLLPAGAVAAGRVPVGRVLATPLREGQILTDTAVLSPSLLEAHPYGTVLTTIRVVDPASMAAVRPGDPVSIVAADLMGAGEAEVVATSVPVVALPDETTGGAYPGTGRPVLLAVDQPTAVRLAAASISSQLSVLLTEDTT